MQFLDGTLKLLNCLLFLLLLLLELVFLFLGLFQLLLKLFALFNHVLLVTLQLCHLGPQFFHVLCCHHFFLVQLLKLHRLITVAGGGSLELFFKLFLGQIILQVFFVNFVERISHLVE